jgi:hypothetical protein
MILLGADSIENCLSIAEACPFLHSCSLAMNYNIRPVVSYSVAGCLSSRCLAMLYANPLQCLETNTVILYNFFSTLNIIIESWIREVEPLYSKWISLDELIVIRLFGLYIIHTTQCRTEKTLAFSRKSEDQCPWQLELVPLFQKPTDKF